MSDELERAYRNKLQKPHMPIVGGLFSDFANEYGWSRDVLTIIRVCFVGATVMFAWPLIVYIVIAVLRFEDII